KLGMLTKSPIEPINRNNFFIIVHPCLTSYKNEEFMYNKQWANYKVGIYRLCLMRIDSITIRR
ncbi:MAG: hypothetical protein AAB326_03455, partial [Pseudomonadota bacterium]